jgi:excisionase family DNA binding protein
MSTAMPHAGRPAFYTVEQAAWILGVSTSRTYRAIRTGTLPTVRRHSRYQVPATALTQLLAEAADRSERGVPISPQKLQADRGVRRDNRR